MGAMGRYHAAWTPRAVSIRLPPNGSTPPASSAATDSHPARCSAVCRRDISSHTIRCAIACGASACAAGAGISFPSRNASTRSICSNGRSPAVPTWCPPRTTSLCTVTRRCRSSESEERAWWSGHRGATAATAHAPLQLPRRTGAAKRLQRPRWKWSSAWARCRDCVSSTATSMAAAHSTWCAGADAAAWHGLAARRHRGSCAA
jgi:hypothetical protein